MAMYRIGPSDLFTNDDLKADAATLDAAIDRLDDLNMEKVSQPFFDGWLSFRSEWKKFYSGTILGSFFGPAWNDSNRDQLIQFENRFQAWSDNYTKETGTTVPDVVTPSTGAGDNLGDQLAAQLRPLAAVGSAYKSWVITGGIIIMIIVFREPILTVAKTLAGKVK